MRKLTELQQAVLLHCGNFGFASTRDISRFVWPNHAAHSAHVMAQRTLSKLTTDGLLLARDLRQTPDTKLVTPPKSGIAKAFVLTTRGAEVLNDAFMDEWVTFDLPAGTKPSLWFSDGYNLSLKDYGVRKPVMDLCAKLATASTDTSGSGLHPVGRRALARNFMGLARYAHFDAVLLDDAGKFKWGIHLAHNHTATATLDISRLAKGPDPFLICCGPYQRLASFIKWRADVRPDMADYLAQNLPPDVEA